MPQQTRKARFFQRQALGLRVVSLEVPVGDVAAINEAAAALVARHREAALSGAFGPSQQHAWEALDAQRQDA